MACPVQLYGVVAFLLHLTVYLTSPPLSFYFSFPIFFPRRRVSKMCMCLTRKSWVHKTVLPRTWETLYNQFDVSRPKH